MKKEIIAKLNFMHLLYGTNRKEMFEEQWSKLVTLVNKLPDEEINDEQI